MLQVSISRLVESIQSAHPSLSPSMNEGTHYLFRSVLNELMEERAFYLSNLDLNKFETEDIHSLNDIYQDQLRKRFDTENLMKEFHRAPASRLNNTAHYV